MSFFFNYGREAGFGSTHKWLGVISVHYTTTTNCLFLDHSTLRRKMSMQMDNAALVFVVVVVVIDVIPV